MMVAIPVAGGGGMIWSCGGRRWMDAGSGAQRRDRHRRLFFIYTEKYDTPIFFYRVFSIENKLLSASKKFT